MENIQKTTYVYLHVSILKLFLFHIPSRLMIPSLQAAKSLMESLKRSMKAALITPLVSSFGFACTENGGNEELKHGIKNIPSFPWISFIAVKSNSQAYIKIKKCIQLILNNWQGFQKFFSIHCPHHTINPSKT